MSQVVPCATSLNLRRRSGRFHGSPDADTGAWRGCVLCPKSQLSRSELQGWGCDYALNRDTEMHTRGALEDWPRHFLRVPQEASGRQLTVLCPRWLTGPQPPGAAHRSLPSPSAPSQVHPAPSSVLKHIGNINLSPAIHLGWRWLR